MDFQVIILFSETENRSEKKMLAIFPSLFMGFISAANNKI